VGLRAVSGSSRRGGGSIPGFVVAHQQPRALVAVVPRALVEEVVAARLDDLLEVDDATAPDIPEVEEELQGFLVAGTNLMVAGDGHERGPGQGQGQGQGHASARARVKFSKRV
jgi:hypothetical protein